MQENWPQRAGQEIQTTVSDRKHEFHRRTGNKKAVAIKKCSVNLEFQIRISKNKSVTRYKLTVLSYVYQLMKMHENKMTEIFYKPETDSIKNPVFKVSHQFKNACHDLIHTKQSVCF